VRLGSFEDTAFVGEEIPANIRKISSHLNALELYRRTNRAVIQVLMDEFRPNVVVVDAFPGGPLESLEAIDMRRTLSVLIEAAFTHEDFVREMAHYSDRFDERLIAWPQELSGHYPGRPSSEATWTGFVTYGGAERLTRQQAREFLGLYSGAKYCLLNIGSTQGSVAHENLRDIFAACDALGFIPVVAEAPLWNRRSPDQYIDTGASELRLRSLNLGRLMPAFDLIISTIGRNSFVECVRANVPLVWIDKARFSKTRHSDQTGLARVATDLQLGLVQTVGSNWHSSISTAVEMAPTSQELLAIFRYDGNQSVRSLLEGLA